MGCKRCLIEANAVGDDVDGAPQDGGSLRLRRVLHDDPRQPFPVFRRRPVGQPGARPREVALQRGEVHLAGADVEDRHVEQGVGEQHLVLGEGVPEQDRLRRVGVHGFEQTTHCFGRVERSCRRQGHHRDAGGDQGFTPGRWVLRLFFENRGPNADALPG